MLCCPNCCVLFHICVPLYIKMQQTWMKTFQLHKYFTNDLILNNKLERTKFGLKNKTSKTTNMFDVGCQSLKYNTIYYRFNVQDEWPAKQLSQLPNIKIPLQRRYTLHSLTSPALMSSSVMVVFNQGRLPLRWSFKVVMSRVIKENVKLS